MTKTTIITLISICFASVSYAEQSADSPANPADDGKNMFVYLDANADGYITIDELNKHHLRNHTLMDTNGDGKADLAEAEARGRGKQFKELDTDNDGYISHEEGFAEEETHFKHADTDHDGKVSWAEYTAHHKTEH